MAAINRPAPGWRSWNRTRRGWRKIDSMAAITLGIGGRSSGPSPSGRDGADGAVRIGPADGTGDAMRGGGVLGSFIAVVWLGSGGEQLADRAEHRLVEVALKGVGPDELHRQSGRTDQRPQDPAEVAAEKQIAGEPGEEDLARNAVAAA